MPPRMPIGSPRFSRRIPPRRKSSHSIPNASKKPKHVSTIPCRLPGAKYVPAYKKFLVNGKVVELCEGSLIPDMTPFFVEAHNHLGKRSVKNRERVVLDFSADKFSSLGAFSAYMGRSGHKLEIEKVEMGKYRLISHTIERR